MKTLEEVIRPIVEGQIRSFLNDHPEVIGPVTWHRAHRKSKKEALTGSLAKRIVRDLICDKNQMRIRRAVVTGGDDHERRTR